MERNPQNWGVLGPRPLAIKAWLTPRNTLVPTCYPAKFGRSMSNGTSVVKEIRLNIFIPRVPPFKVTDGHRN